MQTNKDIRRVVLICLYCKNSTLKQWHRYLLYALKSISNKLIVIVNGLENLKDIDIYSDCVFYRENSGYDFAAWGHAFKKLGFSYFNNYDELILCNSSCYGPVISLHEVFQKMQNSNADFWGLYDHPAIDGVFSHHLQSYFLVFKKKMFSNACFSEYWRQLKISLTWDEAVKLETNLTTYFERKGFVSDSLIKSNQKGINSLNPTIHEPAKLLELGFPFIKRKVFSENMDSFTEQTINDQGFSTISYISKKTNYPIELIYEDLKDTLPASRITQSLGLVFHFGDYYSVPDIPSCSVGLVLYSYYEDLISLNINYISSMPKGSTIVIVVVSSYLKEKWEPHLYNLICKYNISVRVQPNKGRNESAYWITCRDLQEKLDYICFIHDKKSPSLPLLASSEWGRLCLDALLYSESHVNRIIHLFETNDRIGLLIPCLPLMKAVLNSYIGNEWGKNLKQGISLYKEIGITAPFDYSPITSWGSMFWIRTKALGALNRKNWSFDDFPDEPINSSDGTILHALERLYPTIVQEAGFFTALVMTDGLLKSSYFNLYEEYRSLSSCKGRIRTNFLINVMFVYVKQKLKKLF